MSPALHLMHVFATGVRGVIFWAFAALLKMTGV